MFWPLWLLGSVLNHILVYYAIYCLPGAQYPPPYKARGVPGRAGALYKFVQSCAAGRGSLSGRHMTAWPAGYLLQLLQTNYERYREGEGSLSEWQAAGSKIYLQTDDK